MFETLRYKQHKIDTKLYPDIRPVFVNLRWTEYSLVYEYYVHGSYRYSLKS